jgi:hypothetical protein
VFGGEQILVKRPFVDARIDGFRYIEDYIHRGQAGIAYKEPKLLPAFRAVSEGPL